MKKNQCFIGGRFFLTACSLVVCFMAFATNAFAQGGNVWQEVPVRIKAQQTAGYSGGEGFQLITSMVMAPSNPNVMFISVDQARVLKSTNAGFNWTPKHRGITSSGVLTVAVHPTNENIVLAAGGNIGFVDPIDTVKGIYRSTDGGENWVMVKSGLTYTFPGGNPRAKVPTANRCGNMLAFGASHAAYTGTHGDGMWKSTDDGVTWTQFASPTVGASIAHVVVDPNNQSVVYVSSISNNRVYKVLDTGASPTITPLSGLPAYANVLVVDKNNSNILYATLREKGVYKSINGGSSWSPINNGIELLAGDWKTRKEVTGLAISPANSNYLYVSRTQSEVYYSHDAGATWLRPQSMDEQNADGWVSGSIQLYADVRGSWQSGPVLSHPSNSNVAYAIGELYHVKKTTDAGKTWKYSNNGYKGGAVGVTATLSDTTTISWSQSDPNRFILTAMDMGVFLTTDGGSTFRFLDNPRVDLLPDDEYTVPARSTSAGAIDPDDPETVVVTNGQWGVQGITVTHNGSSAHPSWKVHYDTAAVHSFVAFHPQKKNIVYSHRWKSTDNGDSWGPLGKKILAMHPANGDIIYGLEYAGANIRIAKSTNAGASWTYPFPDLIAGTHFIGAPNDNIGEFAADPSNDNILWVAISKMGVYKITAGGSVVLKSNGITPDFNGLRYSRNIAIDPRNSKVLYTGSIANHLGSAQGVFRSTDGGENWTNINYNLGSHFTAFAIEVNPHNSWVYVGSYEGTWKLPPPGTGGGDGTSPVVTISSPTTADSYTAAQASVSVSGSASDNVGVTSVTWTNSLGGSGNANGTSSWNIANIPLLSGENAITVTARDAAGNVGVDTLKVSYAPVQITLSVSANRTLVAPVINGNPNEAVWNLNNSVAKLIYGTNNNTVSFGTLWDYSYLYVAVKVLDSALKNDSPNVWEDDSVEIYLDGKHEHSGNYDANDHQLIKGYNDAATSFYDKNANAAGIKYVTANIPGGFAVELAIPWSNLGISSPVANLSLGLDIEQNDDDNGGALEGFLNWNSSSGTNYQTTVNFGHLVLSATTVGSVDPTPPTAPGGLRVVQ